VGESLQKSKETLGPTLTSITNKNFRS